VLNLFRITLTFVLLFAVKANARTCVENIIGVEPTKLILENPELVEEILARRTFFKGIHFRIPEYAPLLVQMIQELDNVPARLSKVQGHAIKKAWLNVRARAFKAQLEQALPTLTYYQSIEFSFAFAWYFMNLSYFEMNNELDDVYTFRYDGLGGIFKYLLALTDIEQYLVAPLDHAEYLRRTLADAKASQILVVPAIRVVSIPEINRLYDYNAATLGTLAYPDRSRGHIRFIRHDAGHFYLHDSFMSSDRKLNAKLSIKAAKLIYPQLDQRLMDERWNYKGLSVSRAEIENAIFRLRHEAHRFNKGAVDRAGSFEKYKETLIPALKEEVKVIDDADNPPTTMHAMEWILDHWEQIWE